MSHHLVFPIHGELTDDVRSRLVWHLRSAYPDIPDDVEMTVERKFFTDEDGEPYEGFPMVHVRIPLDPHIFS